MTVPSRLMPSFVIGDKTVNNLFGPHFPPVNTWLFSQDILSSSPRSGALASNRLTPKFPEQELPIHLYIEQQVQRCALVLPVFQGHGGWRRCGMCAQRVMQERLQLTVTEIKGHPPNPRQRFPRWGTIRDTRWNKSNRFFYLDISKSHSSWALRIS